jgi:hypothetical protein
MASTTYVKQCEYDCLHESNMNATLHESGMNAFPVTGPCVAVVPDE